MATEPREHSVEHAFNRLKALEKEAAEIEAPQETETEEIPEETQDEEIFETPVEQDSEEELAFDGEDEPEEETEGDENLPDLSIAGFNATERDLIKELPTEVQDALVRLETARDDGIRKQLSEVQTQRLEMERVQADLAQAREAYAKALQEQVLSAPELQEPPDELLDPDSENYDPERYQLLDIRFRKAQRQREQQMTQLRQVHEEQEKQREEAIKAEKIRSAQKLATKFPDWRKTEKLREGVKQVREYLVSPQYDIKPEVANNVYDADMLTIAWKAMRYDQLTSEQKKVKKAPKQVKSAGKSRPRTTTAPEVLKEHKEKGTVASALAALKARDQQRKRA